MDAGPNAQRDQLQPGDTLGKYRVVRRIGSGGMATIYLATSAGPGGFEKPCALKLMRPEFSEGSGAAALAKEARIAAHLNHPNIVQVFDLGRAGRDYYMTMEWVDGAALHDLLVFSSRRQQRPSVGVAASIALQVAEALAYLRDGVVLDGERASLVHRDVSPSNVLISTAGVAKLADFGIVKVLEAPAHTKVGVVKGKYAYMSPEQLRGDAIDHRSDLFALGIVLWETLTCARLFYRKSLAATVAAVHAARVPPPSEINASVPSELDHLVLRLLAKNPAHRFAGAHELLPILGRFTSAASRSELGELARAFADDPARRAASGISPRPSSSQALPLAPPARAQPPPPAPVVELSELDSAEFEALEEVGDGATEGLPDFHTVAAAEAVEPPPDTVSGRPDAAPRDTAEVALFRSQPSELPVQSAPAAPRWLPLVIVGLAVASTAVFWWMLLGSGG